MIPTTYFFVVASPEQGGMMARMPVFVGQINKALLPMFKRDADL